MLGPASAMGSVEDFQSSIESPRSCGHLDCHKPSIPVLNRRACIPGRDQSSCCRTGTASVEEIKGAALYAVPEGWLSASLQRLGGQRHAQPRLRLVHSLR